MHSAYRAAMRVAIWNMILNGILALLKWTVGWWAGSNALMSDGIHSVGDAISAVVVMVGLRLSLKGADKTHPYGRERLECVAALVLAGVVAASGIGIALTSVKVIVQGVSQPSDSPLLWMTACMAMGIKEVMFRYTRRAAKISGSSALMADAWHQRTDALSSLGSLAGVVGARCGWPILDPLAGLLIAGLIIKAAVEVFADASRKMTDRACDIAVQEQIRQCVAPLEGVEEVMLLRSRLFGNRVLVEMTIRVACGMKADEAYQVAQTVQTAVENEFEAVKMCSVHIHPSEIPLVPLQNHEGYAIIREKR